MITDKASDVASTAWQGTADALGQAGQEIRNHAQQQTERVAGWLENHLPTELTVKPAELVAKVQPTTHRARNLLLLGGGLGVAAGAVAWMRARSSSLQDVPLVGRLGEMSRTRPEPVHPSAVPQTTATSTAPTDTLTS